jgi:hypothetical protein
MLALIGFSVSLLLLNVDAFIAKHNVQRAIDGQDLDVAYLASLSPDAVPALVDWYTDPALDPEIQDGVGASLACINADPTPRDTDWRSFNLSVWQADNALATIDLSGYILDNEEWPSKVITPMEQEYDCYTYVD